MCKAMEDMRNESLQEGIREGMKEGMKKGIKEGMKEGIKKTALQMLKAGKYTLEEIAEITELPLEEVKNLQAGRRA